MSINEQGPDIGREIGNYQLTSLLGEGGMGKVFRAKHTKIGKEIAVKLLNKEHSTDAESVARFFREARVVNEIHHENIIDTIDFGQTPEGESYLLMELLSGQSLSGALKATNNAPMPPKRLAHIALQVCSALDAAHQKNVIHRDIKTDNIFLLTRANQRDFVKVLDFGIARVAKEDASVATNTGAVLGTPLYISPEQALGQKVGPQSDVYSLGVMLYLMATGAAPFYDPNPISLAMLHVLSKPKPPKERVPTINDKLNATILKCLEKKLSDRYTSMKDLAADLGIACGVDPGPYFGQEGEVAAPISETSRIPQKRSIAPLVALVGALTLGGAFFAFSGKELQAPAASLPAPFLLEAPTPKIESAPMSQNSATTQEVTPSKSLPSATPEAKIEKPKKKKAVKEEDFDKVIIGP